MKCIKEEQLWEYLDNEVDDVTKRQIESHLEACPKCQEELQELTFFNTQFDNAIKSEAVIKSSKQCLIEIELSYAEIRPVLQRFWKQIALFGIMTIAATLLFITLACPISGRPIFEPQFHAITYSLSQMLLFMARPMIMTIWFIPLTFSFLFWADKMWLSTRKKGI